MNHVGLVDVSALSRESCAGQGRLLFSDMERASEAPAETIVIYYDSYENLLAQGVPVAPLPLARFQPNPFPDRGRFVPDPKAQ